MQILLIFTGLTVFALMFTIGLNQSLKQFVSLSQRPAILIPALLSVLVLFPAVAILLVWLFELPPEAATGIAVLAAAAGAPLTTKRSEMAMAEFDYVSSLQLIVAFSAVFVAPLVLAIFYVLFDINIEPVSPLVVAGQVGLVAFLPVAIGLLLQRLAPKLAEAIRKPFQKTSHIMFLLLMLAVVVLVVFVPVLRDKLAIGWPAAGAILILAVAALACGHLLGGPTPARRSGLAIVTVARNVGLALHIVNLCPPGEESIPTILAYALIAAGVAIPYSIWMKRQMPETVKPE